MTTDEQLKAEYPMEDFEGSDDEYEADSDGATQKHRNVHLSLDVDSCDGAPHDQTSIVETTDGITRDEEDIPVDDDILEMDCYLTAKEIRDFAGEAGVTFFSISGSDFIEMFVGVSPSRVKCG